MGRSTPSRNSEEQGLSSTSTLISTISLGEKNMSVEGDEHHNHLVLFSPTLFLLTFLVVLITAGLGVTMICWFVIHTRQGGFMDIWTEGAFLLDEGTQLEGNLEAARLAGLTIASAAVSSLLALLIWR